jgi:hypothetical protein
MRTRAQLIRSNLKHARVAWGHIPRLSLRGLEELTRKYGLSVALGDVNYIDEHWYVTHAGLLRLAERTFCSAIRVRPVREFCDSLACRWVFEAVVYKTPGSRGFVGYGDADPSNVSPLVRGAELRIAETRAVNRALRKAYGIGLCSVEELRWPTTAPIPSNNNAQRSKPCASNGSSNGHPRLRDQLCLLIRKYELDPTLVKLYAVDFCGTEALRDASRDLVEAFISRLAEAAAKDRAALVCKLNSYAQLEEVKGETTFSRPAC